MKTSYNSLQHFFEKPLPSLTEVADAFTFHSFEIDSIEGDILDIKVLPNRAKDCGTEEGIARQLAAILDMPLKAEFASVKPGTVHVHTSLAQINGTLGSDFSKQQVEDVFRRLRFSVTFEGDTYVITPPAERVDLTIPVDIAEEVGQIIGYDHVPATELPPSVQTPDHARYRGIEKMKDELVEQGYIEVSTQSFAKKGDIELANPLDKSKPFLRTSLEQNLHDALVRAKQHAPLILPPNQKPKLFEVGTVFPKEGEHVELRTVPSEASTKEGDISILPLEDYGKDYVPKKYTLGMYKAFSLYPFMTRDIACWVSSETNLETIHELIQEHAQGLLVRFDQFDRFEKEGRVSLAFRLVFQSMDRTLTDEEVSGIMTNISSSLASAGYEIR